MARLYYNVYFTWFLVLVNQFQLIVASSGSSTLPSESVHAQSQLDLFVKQNYDSSLSSGCQLACTFLKLIAPGKVSTPGQVQYDYEESRYWSQQQATISPVCRLAPTTPIDVSIALLTLKTLQCSFAVKSGGHAAFTGASNINGGVTIDLLNMNTVAVSTDKKQVSYGAGARWIEVYNVLVPQGLGVVGGRVADIGVGGLTLGGGISFFSGSFGWACDTVNNYEVVLADGSVREVSQATYPDLYFALRGGGNNFGIVTRFDVIAFPLGLMWGGMNDYFFAPDTDQALISAYSNYLINAPLDPYAAVILNAAYVQSIDTFIWAGDYHYSKPVVNPPIFENFTAVTPFASTNRLDNLTDFTIEFNNTNPGGFRQTYWTLTIKNDAVLVADIVAIWQTQVKTVKDVAGILPSLGFEPLTTDMSSHFTSRGGNALGITTADGPLSVVLVDFSYSNATDDSRIFEAARNIINQSNATAVARGLGHGFIYQNYASAEQNVFPSYGPENYAELELVSAKYDPTGVFKRLQPGYFKL